MHKFCTKCISKFKTTMAVIVHWVLTGKRQNVNGSNIKASSYVCHNSMEHEKLVKQLNNDHKEHLIAVSCSVIIFIAATLNEYK